MKNTLQRIWEQASIYLPVLLMVMLALGTWWLVRNAPKPLLGKTETVVSAEPDYTLENFSVHQFDAKGRLQSVIQGEEARHLPQSDTLEIDRVRTRSLAPDGTVTVSSAKRGASNSDASEVQLWGDAVVERVAANKATPALKLEGEFLHAWTNEERVKSHLPVVITRGNDQFHGDSLDYDNLSQMVEMKGRVRGVINPD